MRNFFKLLMNGYDDRYGVIYDEWHSESRYPIAENGVQFEGLDGVEFSLKNGGYAPFMRCTAGVYMISEELKRLFEEYPDYGSIEYIPVSVKSETCGDRTYYILHFTKVFDVIDYDHCKKVPETGSITVLALNYENVKNLNVFAAESLDVIVSDKIKREMKKRGLTGGFMFKKVACF